MNRVEIRGGLVRDSESRMAGHAMLCSFTVAVNGTRYDSETRQQVVKTVYVTCQAWAALADQITDDGGLQQGDDVYVVGELDQYRKADDDKPSTRVTVLAYSVLRRRTARSSARPAMSESHPTYGSDPWA